MDRDNNALTVANLIGAAIQLNAHDNFMARMVRQLLSPMLTARNRKSRPIIKAFNFQTITMVKLPQTNPYTYQTGWNQEMEPVMMGFMNQMITLFFKICKDSKLAIITSDKYAATLNITCVICTSTNIVEVPIPQT